MFTGLIEDLGKIAALRLRNGSAVMTVQTKLPFGRMAIGASIAVNGACLTVVKKLQKRFHRRRFAGNSGLHELKQAQTWAAWSISSSPCA